MLGLYLRMMVLPVPPDLATATAGNLTTTVAQGAVDGVCGGEPGMGEGTMGVPSMRAALLAARDWLDAYAQWSDVVVLLVSIRFAPVLLFAVCGRSITPPVVFSRHYVFSPLLSRHSAPATALICAYAFMPVVVPVQVGLEALRGLPVPGTAEGVVPPCSYFGNALYRLHADVVLAADAPCDGSNEAGAGGDGGVCGGGKDLGIQALAGTAVGLRRLIRALRTPTAPAAVSGSGGVGVGEGWDWRGAGDSAVRRSLSLYADWSARYYDHHHRSSTGGGGAAAAAAGGDDDYATFGISLEGNHNHNLSSRSNRNSSSGGDEDAWELPEVVVAVDTHRKAFDYCRRYPRPHHYDDEEDEEEEDRGDAAVRRAIDDAVAAGTEAMAIIDKGSGAPRPAAHLPTPALASVLPPFLVAHTQPSPIRQCHLTPLCTTTPRIGNTCFPSPHCHLTPLCPCHFIVLLHVAGGGGQPRAADRRRRRLASLGRHAPRPPARRRRGRHLACRGRGRRRSHGGGDGGVRGAAPPGPLLRRLPGDPPLHTVTRPLSSPCPAPILPLSNPYLAPI